MSYTGLAPFLFAAAQVLEGLQTEFENKMADQDEIKKRADSTRDRMQKATALIQGLGGEMRRWQQDKKSFAERKQRLVGDSAVAAAFLCYTGGFNQSFRSNVLGTLLPSDLHGHGIPFSGDFDAATFLLDRGTVGEWHLQGLPSDDLSTQNGILITRAGPKRYPLLIDPQGQGLQWLIRREQERRAVLEAQQAEEATAAAGGSGSLGAATTSDSSAGASIRRSTITRVPGAIGGTAASKVLGQGARGMAGGGGFGANFYNQLASPLTLRTPRLRDVLEYALAEGLVLILSGVEEELPRMWTDVMQRQIVQRGRSQYIRVGDAEVDFNPDFQLYITTRLPNPHFSPELQAAATVVDFTVTEHGLEEQLLARVIEREQKSLEDQLHIVLKEVNDNTKALEELDNSLLQRLSASQGQLIDDAELINVLGSLKEKALEVSSKLKTAAETRRTIRERREYFRPVARRGSELFFSITDFSSVNSMYQTSLEQFLRLFGNALDRAERSPQVSKRVAAVVGTLTNIVVNFVSRGLYTQHKLPFRLVVALRMLRQAEKVSRQDVDIFLKVCLQFSSVPQAMALTLLLMAPLLLLLRSFVPVFLRVSFHGA